MNHDQAYENLEGLVFGTLEQSEVEAVETHLHSGCDECHARLREISELSVQLAGAVPQHDPPSHIKHQLMDRISRQKEKDAAAAVGEPARRAPWWRMWVPAAVMATVLVVAMGVANRRSDTLREDITSLRDALRESQTEVTEMRSEMAAMNEASRLLGLPCTRLVSLAGVDPNPQAAGRFVVHPDEPVGVLYVYKMPQAPDGMQYQLWTLRDGQPSSVGLFTVADDGSAVLRTGQMNDPRGINEFKVTIEPMGGRKKPEGMLYLTGENILDPMH